MPALTPRQRQIEALLADEPNDPFLRYGFAMEYAGQGADAEAAQCLTELTAVTPYVPAYLMLGQILARMGEESQAVTVLRAGILEAEKVGNDHAAGEMRGLLATLE